MTVEKYIFFFFLICGVYEYMYLIIALFEKCEIRI